METSKKYSLGLALSGGGAKGFAHLGVLKALEEKGIQPDIISGTSAGALAGVLYADGYSPEEILSFFDNKTFKHFAEFTIPHAGIFKNDRIYAFLKKHLRSKNFEDLKIPLRVTTTDIENGVTVVFEKGEIIPTIVASCAFPIVFTPVEIEGVHYVDGGLFKNFPVSVIREDCEKVLGVNVTPLTLQKYKPSLFYIAEQSFHYISVSNSLADRELCDILIESTALSKFQMFSLEHIQTIYNIGHHVTQKRLKENLLLARA